MKNLCKRLWKEILILLLQLLIFFVFPLFADSAEPLGMVLSILSATSMLSILLGCVSKEKIKYIYPIITALFFLADRFYLLQQLRFDSRRLVFDHLRNRNWDWNYY